MAQGTIKKITDKGFGFIQRDGGQQDLFFHCSAVSNDGFDTLTEGDTVQFDEGRGDKGPRAENVQAVS
jgi:CspA family cold shock protein